MSPDSDVFSPSKRSWVMSRIRSESDLEREFRSPPRANAAFWRKKLVANQARDRRQVARLRAAGWEVIRIWECDLWHGPADGIRTVMMAMRPKRRAG